MAAVSVGDGLHVPQAIWSRNGRVTNGLADVAQNGIESMCGRMDFRRLLRPDRDNARPHDEPADRRPAR